MDAYVTNWNGSNPWEDNNSSSLAWTEEDEIASVKTFLKGSFSSSLLSIGEPAFNKFLLVQMKL